MNLLKSATKQIAERAKEIIKQKKLALETDDRDEEVFIEALVIARCGGERHVGEAVICGAHDRLVLVRRNGQVMWQETNEISPNRSSTVAQRLDHCSLADLIEMARKMSVQDRQYLLTGIALNTKAAEVGLKLKLGLGIGAAFANMSQEGYLGQGVLTRIKQQVAAAADAAGAFSFERVPAGLVTLTADAIGSVDAGRLTVTVPALDTIDVTLPLAGYRVLELAHLVAGPVCGMLLADLGDQSRLDGSCGVLYGTLRDSAYKLRHLAEQEIQRHKDRGVWDVKEQHVD